MTNCKNTIQRQVRGLGTTEIDLLPLPEGEASSCDRRLAVDDLIERLRAVKWVRGSGLQGKGAAKAKAQRTEVVWRNPRAVSMTR